MEVKTSYLGNNYWMLDDGRLLNTDRQTIIEAEDVPDFFKFERMVGHYEFVTQKSAFPRKNGTKFVTVDYCEDFFYSKTGKTKYARFLNFDYVSVGSYKPDNGDWIRADYDFEKHEAYLFFMEVNPNYYANLKIIRIKKLKKDE
jgi:hypothetical protein